MAMDVVAIPSEFEGFGLCAVEAMAFEKPVVGTRVDGLQDIVSPGETGYLVDYRDVHGLAARLGALLANAETAIDMGRAGLRRVEHRFSIEVFSERWLSLYETLETTL